MSLMLLFMYIASMAVLQAPETRRLPAANARVAGVVRDAESNRPVAGVSVGLAPALPPSSFRRADIPRQVLTGDDGWFTFEGVGAGRFTISAQLNGFVLDPADARTIDVAAGQSIVGIELTLRKGSVVAGRVLHAGSEPTAGIRVVPSRPFSGPDSHAVPVIIAYGSEINEVGEFRVANLPAGDYLVMATPPPPPPFDHTSAAAHTVLALTYYPGTTDRDAAQVVSVGWGETIDGLVFPILSAAAYSVSGVVVDEQGRGLAGVMLLLMDLRPGASPTPATGPTNADGTFFVGGIVPGTYRLHAVTPRMQSAAAGGFPIGPALLEVRVNNADVTGLKIVPPKPH